MTTSELKPLSHEALEAALERALHYRLLNEPIEAESICRDVLRLESDNQLALVTLLLSLSDQFEQHLSQSFSEAREIATRLGDEYSRIYYQGLICERRARALWRRGGLGAGPVTHDWLQKAMDLYQQAEPLLPEGNDDAILRWNACVRTLRRHRDIRPAARDTFEPLLE